MVASGFGPPTGIMKAVAKDDGVTPVANAAGSRAGEDATPAGRTGERVAHPATPISTDSTASSGIANARVMAFIMPQKTAQMTRIDRDRAVAPRPVRPTVGCPRADREDSAVYGYAKVGSRSPVIFAFGCRVLSTTLASSAYLVPFCHWMPTGGVIATPGAGFVLALVEV